jgi:hypothetical protein
MSVSTLRITAEIMELMREMMMVSLDACDVVLYLLLPHYSHPNLDLSKFHFRFETRAHVTAT